MPRRVPLEMVQQVLRLYRETYFDFNVRHFYEKLRELYGISLSCISVKLARRGGQGAGLAHQNRLRGAHRKRRLRRPLPGMLLHLDGSSHAWFADQRGYDLLVVLDEVTREIYYAQPSGMSRNSFAWFTAKSSGDLTPGFCEMRRGRTDIGRRFRNFRQWVDTGILKGAENVRDRQGRLAKRAVMLKHITRQHGFGRLLQPLIDQCSDFTSKVCSMVQASQLKTLQRRT
jgi:hypothetical protein